jgi:hypothetical protein
MTVRHLAGTLAIVVCVGLARPAMAQINPQTQAEIQQMAGRAVCRCVLWAIVTESYPSRTVGSIVPPSSE